ncbi:UDP-N-acetylmuramate--L-alanine ligase [Acidaminococcus sp. NSJ-142]|uniref:UDP-N-acetylmuramate--L-alanine ligase n=1 Tax=Acidaminococcus TaxID=904 RepID=UPI000CF9E990|nr:MULTISPECIES: UDP-N-acetylmuramate--L-alanine ligase [Acidaminococcus]MCD2434804.1 UDP-N-acetylmuramate--L-alanine ligase [Acidaminococcus hominis]MCH4095890.1 UDP-N-acetylmuramate--L-alanine ligase [Acidaminococcus provencensis]RHK02403.1 UDP-N-acetylmuramate--L-alanine ligase [Acidaminococcus sp. AM05-11]
MLDLDKIKNIHFIGIGGAGMSALSYVMIKRGYQVSGSDAKPGYMATNLAKEGALVFIGHSACQIERAEVVVVSTAIHPDNPELVEAKKRQVPVIHRSDVLAYLMNKHKGVAVAGAHGKTTTSSMLSCITCEGGLDPTIVVGGIVNNLGSNAVNGKSDYVVAEADESDGSFLKFHPYLAVITNIENDHLDHYGSEENIQAAFAKFVEQIKEDGKAILCYDNAKVRALGEKTGKTVISYGIDSKDADYRAENIEYGKNGTTYDILYKNEVIGKGQLIVPGRHNVLNSLGAIAAARELGIPLESILASLAHFSGAKRRFETKGKVGGVWVVDDYAHHPTEIAVTLKAARQTQPERLVCVFQPHRYTRTQLLLDQFAVAFKDCDELIITDIYAASEDPIPGVSGEMLAHKIAETTGQKVRYISGQDKIEETLEREVRPGDLVITMGAGDIYRLGEQLVQALERSEANA